MRRGFSLLELMVASSLVAMMGGLLAMNLRAPQARGKASGLAQTVASELRQARQLAVATQAPVAVVIPGQTGGSPTSYAEGLYFLEGWAAPRITRSASYSGDFPGCSIFNGSWAVDSSQFRDPAAPANIANLNLPGQKWANLDLNKWIPAASARDYCFVFGPDGTCRTNDLPAFDNAYHLLVTSGVGQFTSAGTPTGASLAIQPAYYTPQKLGETYTVNIDGGGAISVSNGITAMSTGAVSLENGVRSSQAGGKPPGPQGPGTPNVVVDAVNTFPQSPNLPPGADVSVSPNGFVTLRTQVSDPGNSGKRLYCNWIVQPVGGIVRGPSAYSIPVAAGRGVAMDWDPTLNAGNGAWISTWQWRPPVDGQAGDRYSLTLAVQDSAGNSLTAAIPPKVASVCPPGEVLYFGGYTMALWADMWKMNPDGSSKQNFQASPYTPNNPSPYNEGVNSASADGNRVLISSDRNDIPGGIISLFLTDREGSYAYQVNENTAPISVLEAGSISPMGGLVVYRRVHLGTTQLVVVNTHPDPLQRRTVVLDDLGLKGGCFLQINPIQIPMASDFPAFDRRINDPARNNILYYVKNTSIVAPQKRMYSLQIAQDPDGKPSLVQPPGTLVPEVNNFAATFGGASAGVRSSKHYVRQVAGGPLTDLLFFTLDRFDGSPTQVCVWDRTANTVAPAYTPDPPQEENPTPWTDGTAMKMFVTKVPLAPNFNSIELLTPVSGAPATGRVELAGGTPFYGLAARQCSNPVYLPKRRN